MDFSLHRTDAATLEELGERLARLRLERNQTQAQLAREAGVSVRTLSRLEGGESTQLTNLIRVLRALELLPRLESLVPEPGPSPLEELRARERGGRPRQRASSRSGRSEAGSSWSWGDEEGQG